MNLVRLLPFYYYLNSRYTELHRRIFHVIKYYGFGILLLILIDIKFSGRYVLELSIVLLLFFNWYDLMCYKNDIKDVPDDRKSVLSKYPSTFTTNKIIIGIIINSITYLLLPWDNFIENILFQVILIIVFSLHNTLNVPFNFLTFYALYFLKSVLFLLPFKEILSLHFDFLVVFGLFNLSYLPKYINRKLGQKNRLFLQPIFLKNFLLTPVIIYDLQFLPLIIFTDFLTLVEWLYTRLKHDI